MKRNQKIRLFLLLSIFFLLTSSFVFALEINYPKVPGATAPQDFVKTASPEQIPTLYVKYIINLVFWASGIIVLGVLMWAGLRYLTAGGKAEAIFNAKQQISSAFFGILILLSTYIILNILNPQLLILSLPKIEPPKVIQAPEVPRPDLTVPNTSIDVELPLGKIINDYLFNATRTTAIRDNAEKTSQIAQTVKQQVDDLRSEVDKCNCGQARPKCKGTINIGGYGSNQKCQTKEGSGCSVYCTDSCSSDVCADQRDNIQDLEKKNLQKLDELKIEQNKSIQLLKELKGDLAKLQRLKSYLTQDCRLWTVQSLKEFLIKINDYKNGGIVRQIKFWDPINNTYNDPQEKKQIRDWASFYCQAGGTTFLKQQPQTPLEAPASEASQDFDEVVKSCPREVPVGDIIDRAERIAKLLIKRLETLIILDRQMIQQVNEMHVLVSKCSSQQPMCCSFCIEVQIYSVKVCIRLCIGQACPFSDIRDKNKEISMTQGMIEETVNDTDENNMGIIPIIDNVIPKLLEDLDREIRLPMRECIIEGADKVLYDCQRLVGALDPQGDIIRTCCNTESVFNECLNSCYLKQGEADYKKCLTDCLNKKAQEKSVEDISWCRHQLNFYCCNVEREYLE